MNGSNLATEIAAAGKLSAPPLAVAGGMAAGAIDPQWYVIAPTAVYVVLQIAYLLWKWRREWKARQVVGDG